MLTSLEEETLNLLGKVANNFGLITQNGPSREQDLQEMAFHVHALQNMLLAQAAANIYPKKYRRLGGDPCTM